MNTVLGLDASFARLDRAFFAQAKALGYRILIQGCWTGGFENNTALREVAEANLRDAQAEGLIVAVYSNANPWYSIATSVAVTRTNAGGMWDAIRVVAVDVEIDGTLEPSIYDLAVAFEQEGKKVCIYTGAWVYDRAGQPDWSRLARWPLWVCDTRNHDPRLDTAAVIGPWTRDRLIGRQYDTESGLLCKEVDLDTFAPDFFEGENMATLEELQAAIDKERADRELGASWLAAAIAYQQAGLAQHEADTLRHLDSKTYQNLDERLKAIGR
jgi:hypothetical protein